MANYDDRKKQYEALDDSHKQMWNDKISKMDAGAEARQFTERYNQEMNNNQQSNNNSSNFNNGNGTNGQIKDQKPITFETEKPINQNEQRPLVSPDLDTSKFGETNGKVTIKEGTAAQTGRPDYQLDSDARMQEITNNLNAYRQNNPEFFKDRNTFNTMFHYNDRDNAQKALLDTYWKKKEDIDSISNYTSGESINNSMRNGEITTDQLNLLKEYNPEAYQKWQQLQEDEIMKRIVNDIVPKTVEEISGKINSMIEALGIQAQDALDIEGIYNDTMAKTGAYQTLEDANRTVKQIEEVINKKNAIMNRYANSTGGTVSDALAAARMAKAIAPYNEQLQGLQYQYQDYSNLYSQKTATAYQAANVRAMQAQENQRIRQQKCSALGFAQTALSYRTPEEQAQLDIQKQQALNESNLLYQSKLQDLNRYNQYATTKMQNQLQAELTDLSVQDEAQLKANLNNVLSDYYKNYGDIIQRSQAQVVDDVIAYAKKNGISVAQAMTENFIKPLQNKAEYKQKVATDYGMLSKQSIGTINGKSVIMTTNPNGSISYQYIEDPEEATSTAKPYDLVDEKVFDTSPQSHSYYTLADFINDPNNKVGTYGGQCAKFVNDYLENIGVGRYFGTEDIKTRASRCNSDTAKVGTIAVFDYNNISSDGINHGHVGVVIDTDDKGYWVLESNFDKNNPEKIQKRYVLNGSPSCKGFFDPSKPASIVSSSDNWRSDSIFEYNGTTYDFSKYPGWQELTDDEWITVQNLLTYQTDPKSLPKSGTVNGQSNSRVRAAAAAIGRDAGYTEGRFGQADKVIKNWQNAAGPGGSSSANSTAMAVLYHLYENFSEMKNTDLQTVNKWINDIKKETGDPTVGTYYSTMSIASSELAKALKGGASPTENEIKERKDLINPNMGTDQAKEIFKSVAQGLYDKNESEAKNFYSATKYKPDPIWTEDASVWMAETLGIDLSKYYNYTSQNVSGPNNELNEIYASAMYDTTNGQYDADYISNLIHQR